MTLPVSVLKKVISSNHIRDFYESVGTLHLLPKTHEPGVYDIQIVPNSKIPSVQLNILSTENRIPFIVNRDRDTVYDGIGSIFNTVIRRYEKDHTLSESSEEYANVIVSSAYNDC